MTGIIIAGHGDWPNALKHSLEMVYGQMEGIETCPVTDVESAEEIKDRIDLAIKRLKACGRYVILLDIFGGSPCHAAVSYAECENVIAITGANLPMLVELVHLRDKIKWEEMGMALLATGRAGIRNVYAELLQN